MTLAKLLNNKINEFIAYSSEWEINLIYHNYYNKKKADLLNEIKELTFLFNGDIQTAYSFDKTNKLLIQIKPNIYVS